MLGQFDLDLKPPAHVNQECYFVYSGNSVLCAELDENWSPLVKEEWLALGIMPIFEHYMGTWNQTACYAVELEEDVDAPPGFKWEGLRQFFSSLDASLFALAGRGMQLLEWHRTHQFCGQCGEPLKEHPQDRAKECESCNRVYYPRLSPCIIVLITRGDEMLLAQGNRHPEGLYSTLAGFIEPGETVEHAVHREVREEVGIKVKNLQYWGSQPWPFPHQLMLGFYAEYQSGDLVLAENEINDAQWWHHKNLPKIPPAATISGQLIRGFLEQLNS